MFIHSIKPIIQLLIIIQSINESINQFNQSINNQSINQSINQSTINQSVIETNRSINESFNHPIQWRISPAAPPPPSLGRFVYFYLFSPWKTFWQADGTHNIQSINQSINQFNNLPPHLKIPCSLSSFINNLHSFLPDFL